MKKSQTKKLIDYLVSENGNWIPSNLLSDFLSVSTRQVRKYIAKINEEAQAQIIISSKAGYKIDMDEYSKYRQDYYESYETPETRRNYIIQKLVSEKDGIDVFDLADELYVSSPTIENDLKIIRQTIKEQQLSLKRERNIIKLEGNEKAKRNLMSKIISSESYDNFILKDEVRLLTFHYHFWDFRTEIRDIFAQNDIFANDYTLNNTALHLIVMIDRIRNHCIINEPFDMTKVKNTPQFQVACQIQNYIEEKFEVKINNNELYNLILVIINNTSIVDYSYITEENINLYIEQKYIDISYKALKKVEDYYYLDAFDEDFITKFTIHIKNLFNRLDNQYSAKNPLTNKIKMTYPLIYDIAVFIAQEFKQDYHVTINEDEIAYIAFHIGAYFENNVQSKSKITCAFIYADYYSIHKTSVDKIMRYFDEKILMQYALSVNNIEKLPSVDLIISTVDIPFNTDYVIINPFITDKDQDSIRNKIKEIYSRKRNNKLNSYLTNFFNENMFYKNIKFQNKEDILEMMCSHCHTLGFTTSNFYNDVLAREKMSSTAFNDVAVPHSLSKSTKKSFISILISEQPFPWDTHEVHIVALIGVSDDSRKIFSEIFDELIEIFTDPYSIKELIQAKDYHDFIEIIQRLINKN